MIQSNPLRSLCAAVMIAGSAVISEAQVIPLRMYSGVGRSIPVEVSTPFDDPAILKLFAPGADAGSPLQEITVPEGTHDLAEKFPQLWSAGSDEIRYVQAYDTDSGDALGAPLILQPLIAPERAVLGGSRQRPTVSWQPSSPGVSGMRAYVERYAVIDTSLGEIKLRFRPDEAPNTVFSFMHLAQGGFYDDVIFHRIIPNFVVQGGDPTGTGTGGPGFNIDLEPSKLRHDFGVISMARGGDPDSNGSQFFLCLSRQGTAGLDGLYTAFGEAVEGAEVIRDLGSVTTGPGDRPVDPPTFRSVRLEQAPPFGTGPEPLSRSAASSE